MVVRTQGPGQSLGFILGNCEEYSNWGRGRHGLIFSLKKIPLADMWRKG